MRLLGSQTHSLHSAGLLEFIPCILAREQHGYLDSGFRQGEEGTRA
jgi:hypothetical protein